MFAFVFYRNAFKNDGANRGNKAMFVDESICLVKILDSVDGEYYPISMSINFYINLILTFN